jgi:hypothetical protein
MFYRLSHINEGSLPATLLIGGTTYLVVRGGLLLEPPGPESDPFGVGEGHSIIKFFGHRDVDEESRFIGSSSEPYRWKAAGQLDISRRESDRGTRFAGVVQGETVRLGSLAGSRLVGADTHLTFVAAPDEPITSDWSQTFDFGPPHVAVESVPSKDEPAVQEAIRDFIARGEPERHRWVQARLEKAWRANA